MRMYLLDKKQRVRRWLKDNDFIEAEMTEEINAANQINFSMPLKDRIADNIYYVAIPTPRSKQKYLLFKLLSERVQNDRIEYQGIEEAYDELKQYGYIKDIRPNDRTAEEMLNMVLEPTRWTLGDVPETNHQSTNFYYITYLEALQKIVGLFNIELTFEVTIDPKSNKITRRQVNVYNQQGQRTGKRFEYGSNLLTIEQEQDSQELITALVGRGKGEQVSEGHDDTPDGYGRRITFADVVWTKKNGNPVDKPAGQEYLVDPEATELYGFSDGNPRIGLTVFEDIEDPIELINATWKALQSLKRPKVSFKASVTDVGKLGLGDTVAIIRHDLKIEYFTRVYKVKHDLLNENNNQIELGDDFSSHSITNSIIKVDGIANEAKESANHAAIAANGKNNNYYSSVQPLAPIEGDIWYKDLGNGETDMYQYHNGGWVFIQSTRDLHVVENQVKEAQQGLSQAKADIINNKQKADADIENLNKSIDANKKVADESLQKLNDSIEANKKVADESLKKLNDSVTNLQGQYDNNVVPNLNKVTNDVADALQKYISAQNNIADLTKQAQQQGKDIAEVTKTVDGLNINYANLAGDVNSTKVDVKGLQTTIGTANGDIAQLKLDAQNLQTMLAGKVDNTTYTNFVNLTNQALNARLTASDLSGYAKTVDVQATANGLQANLNSVTEKLDNMVLGSRNLIRNSGFPQTNDFWDKTATVSTHPFYYDGTQNLFCINNSSSNEITAGSSRFKLKRNTNYVFSFKGFQSWNMSSYDVFILRRKNGETSDWTAPLQIITGQRLSNGSLQYVRDIVFNSGEYDEAFLRFDNNGSSDGQNSVFFFGEVKLEEGNKSTAWTSAPDDEKQRVDDITSQLSAQIKANSQQFSSYYTRAEVDGRTNSAKNDAINSIKNDGNWQGLSNILTNSGFLQTADGFLQKVQQTTVPMFNGGGVNLLQGTADFRPDNLWQPLNAWIRTNETYNGLTIFKGKVDVDWDGMCQYYPVKEGETYTFSLNARYESGTGKSTFYALLYSSQEGQYKAANITPLSLDINLNENWQRRSFTFTATSDGYIKPRIERTNNNKNILEICGFKLERGSVATPWTPNPADMATQSAFSELSQSLDGLRSTVGSNYGDLLTQISQSSSAVRTELTNKITGVQNQITTTANGLDAKIAGIRVGGRNLIQNSNASIDRAVPWENTTLQAHSFYYNGTKKMFVLQTNSKNELISGSNWFKIKPGQKYTFSFWGFQSWNMSNYDVWLLLRHSGENGSYDSTYQIVTGERLSNGSCQKVTRTFTAPDGYDEAYIRLDNNGSNNGNNAVFFFNELKLEEGTIATDWSPAPEDTDQAFTEVNATIEGLRSTVGSNYGSLQSQISQSSSTLRTELTDKINGIDNKTTSTANSLNSVIGRVGSLETLTNIQVVNNAINANDYTNTGNYFIQSTDNTNVPAANWFYLKVEKVNDGRIVQTWQADSDPTLRYVRTKFGDSWTQWQRSASYSEYSELNRTVQGLQSTVSGNYGNLQSQINQTATTLRGEVTDKVNGLQGQITTQANNINLMLGTAGDLSNICRNPTFDNHDGWTDSVHVESNWPEIPTKNCGVLFTRDGYYGKEFTVVPGDRYYTSVFANNQNDVDFVLGLHFKMKDGSDQWLGGSWIGARECRQSLGSIKVPDNAVTAQIWASIQKSDNFGFTRFTNVIVKKNDTLAQINMSAGTTLIQNNKIYMDASSTVFSGNAFIPSAAITSLDADKITTGTLNAANVNIINLNADNIVAGTLRGSNGEFILNSGSLHVWQGGHNTWVDQNGIHDYENGNDTWIQRGQLQVTNPDNEGFFTKDGAIELTSKDYYNNNYATKYGKIMLDNNMMNVGTWGMNMIGRSGWALKTANYDGDDGWVLRSNKRVTGSLLGGNETDIVAKAQNQIELRAGELLDNGFISMQPYFDIGSPFYNKRTGVIAYAQGYDLTTQGSPRLELYGPNDDETRGHFQVRLSNDSYMQFYDGAKHAGTMFNLQVGGKTMLQYSGNELYTNVAKLAVQNDLMVYGSKNAVVPTSQGMTAINAYETAEYYFGDISEGSTDGNGMAKIKIDPLFLETVNTKVPYQVFLTAYDDARVWIADRSGDSFTVKSSSPNTHFAWEIKAKRKGYEKDRLKTVNVPQP